MEPSQPIVVALPTFIFWFTPATALLPTAFAYAPQPMPAAAAPHPPSAPFPTVVPQD